LKIQSGWGFEWASDLELFWNLVREGSKNSNSKTKGTRKFGTLPPKVPNEAKFWNFFGTRLERSSHLPGNWGKLEKLEPD